MESKYVIVATKSRPWDVLAGELVSQDGDGVVLTGARMIVLWGTDGHSIAGVAATGRGLRRVSSAVDRAEVMGVELILTCSAEARMAIEAEPWT
jgi:hypothetical protein